MCFKSSKKGKLIKDLWNPLFVGVFILKARQKCLHAVEGCFSNESTAFGIDKSGNCSKKGMSGLISRLWQEKLEVSFWSILSLTNFKNSTLNQGFSHHIYNLFQCVFLKHLTLQLFFCRSVAVNLFLLFLSFQAFKTFF